MTNPTTYTLSELCEAADVSERTVRYYVAQGLLPSPGSGRGVRWSPEHLERLLLILHLKEKHLPLAERSQQPAATAVDYVQQVLAGIRPAPARKSAAPRPASAAPPTGSLESQTVTRTTWERINLDPDVELHIRRPLSRLQDKRVQRLLTRAREIFDTEES